jgi:hypothetical protein
VATSVAAILALIFGALAVPVSVGRDLSNLVQPQLFTWGLWLLLSPLVFMVAGRAHAAGIGHWKGLLIHLTAGPLIALVHTILFALLRWTITLSGRGSVENLIAAMISFGYGGALLRYALIAAAFHALAFQRDARRHMINQERLAATLARTRLEALEARLHPHFLFNTLNTVTSLIRTNQNAAVQVVENLGELLRAALRAEPGREVPLSSELQLLQCYVDIQRARFGDRISITTCIASEVLEARVPQLILQPLVENAIRHGLAPREGPGSLCIEGVKIGETIRVTVRDNGVGFGKAREFGRSQGTGIGLNNTAARLNELYGTRAALTIEPATPSGTIASITIPFHTGTLENRALP